MGVSERRQREREERRAQILDAAEQVFLEKGLASATMDQVAAVAEVSKGTLYLYFRSKDDLYLSSAQRTLSQLCELFEQELAKGGLGLARLQNMIAAHERFAMQEPERFRLGMAWMNTDYSIDESTPSYPEYRAQLARVFGLAASAIELGKTDGSIRPEIDATLFTTQLWGALLGVLLLWLNGDEVTRRMPEPVSLDAMVRGFSDVILAGIRTTSSAPEVDDGLAEAAPGPHAPAARETSEPDRALHRGPRMTERKS